MTEDGNSEMDISKKLFDLDSSELDKKSLKYINLTRESYTNYALQNSVNDIPPERAICWNNSSSTKFGVFHTKFVSNENYVIGLIVSRGLESFPLCELYWGSLYAIGCLGRKITFEILLKKKAKNRRSTFFWNGQVCGWAEMNPETPLVRRYLKSEHLFFDSNGKKICDITCSILKKEWQLNTEFGEIKYPFKPIGRGFPLLDSLMWKEYFMIFTYLGLISSRGYDA